MSVGDRPEVLVGSVGDESSESAVGAGGIEVGMKGVTDGGGRGLKGYGRGVDTAGLLALRGIFLRGGGSECLNGPDVRGGGPVVGEEAVLGEASIER